MIIKHARIVFDNQAESVIPKIIKKGSVCYYLDNEYARFVDIKKKLAYKIEIMSLSGLFDTVLQEIKKPIIDLSAQMNKKHDSVEWWGGQVASRNTGPTLLLRNIVYLFCSKKIFSVAPGDVILIVKNQALSECISSVAIKYQYRVKVYRGITGPCSETIKLWLCYFARISCYFWKISQNRRVAFKLLKPLPAKKFHVNKRIVIRSWVTDTNFDKSGKFSERNFGCLPEWLGSKKYEIWHLPMFFGLTTSLRVVYSAMGNHSQSFLIPYHYLKACDYLKVLRDSYRNLRICVNRAEINQTDVAPLINDAIKRSAFEPGLSILNLCYPMLQRLRERGFEIDGFCYSFENNSPEKQFVLGCRKYFTDSTVIGFQHTAFYFNQLAYYLAGRGEERHPLPDKIVCSGPAYIQLLKNAGFPAEILVSGPNLRFQSVYMNKQKISPDGKKILLLPLTFCYDLAFELLVKINNALKNLDGYRVYIRSHSSLSKKTIIRFLNNIGMAGYEFADGGAIQEWLPMAYAAISTGGSIVSLEAVVAGVPLIRVVPDNSFFYDPLNSFEYPLKPINSSLEIKAQLIQVEEFIRNKAGVFTDMGRQALARYFAKPDEENLKVFL